MEDIQVHIISDSEEEQDVFCDATVRHAALQGHMKDYRRSLQATASLTSAANNASSPIALEQQQVIHDRGCLARQLYRNGFAEDHELTATRQRYLDATGKAPEVEPAPVKAEGDHHQRQPTEHDIQQLEEELAGNPSLLHQLENGEGSSNPMHLWRLRVFQELQKSQLDLLTHMQQQSLDRCQQQDTSQRRLLRKVVEVIVIPDSEDPEDADTPNTHQQTNPAPQVKAEEHQANHHNHRQQCAQQHITDSSGGATRRRLQGSAAAAAAQQCIEQLTQHVQPPLHEAQAQQRDSRQQHKTQRKRQPLAAAAPAGSKPAKRQRKDAAAAAPAAAAVAAAAEGLPGPAADGAPLDPKQQQRRLRAELRKLDASAMRHHEHILDSKSGKLMGLLLHAQDLGLQADRPREAAQHAGVLSNLVRDGVAMISSFSREVRGRHPNHLVHALQRAFAGSHHASGDSQPACINWLQLGTATTGMFRTVPGASSMLGALSSSAKVRAAGVRRQRQAAAPEERPIEGPAAIQHDQGLGQQTERVVEDMRRVMMEHKSCSVVELVLDHDSFAHTVENVFVLSFLCKDMWVKLEVDAEAGLLVQHISKQQRQDLLGKQQATGAGGHLAGVHQFMLGMDMAMWADMCRVVPRGKSLMPQRPTRPR